MLKNSITTTLAVTTLWCGLAEGVTFQNQWNKPVAFTINYESPSAADLEGNLDVQVFPLALTQEEQLELERLKNELKTLKPE